MTATERIKEIEAWHKPGARVPFSPEVVEAVMKDSRFLLHAFQMMREVALSRAKTLYAPSPEHIKAREAEVDSHFEEFMEGT